MSFESLTIFLAQGTAPATDPNPTGQSIKMFSLMAFMFLAFYFMMIRPQQKKQKEHAQMLKGVKPKDKILTSGGILGEVITVKEKTVTIRSTDTKLEITKSAIAEILERGGESSESKES